MTRTIQAIPGPETVHRTILENGLILLVRENPIAPVAVMEGFIPTGSLHDPKGKEGLASFTASLLTRGSEKYDFDTFNEIVESVGASLTAGAGTHATRVSSESLSEDLPRIIELLGDLIQRPRFAPEQVERVRRQWLVRLQERAQDTRSMAHLQFDELLYGDHPYGRSTSGYVETIGQLTRDDLVDFHGARYTPRGAILVVSGDVSVAEVEDLVRGQLGSWQGGAADQTVPLITPIEGIRRDTVVIPGKVQADIVIGCLAIARTDPDYYPAQVANSILGRFGLMGRLGETVREKQGLAYYSYSALSAGKGTGPWYAAAGVNPANVERTVESILAEFKRLAQEPVSDKELADSKANMTGSLPLRLETNGGVASVLLSAEWFGLGLDYLGDYVRAVDAVSVDDVQRVAATYLEVERYALSVAGPESVAA